MNARVQGSTESFEGPVPKRQAGSHRVPISVAVRPVFRQCESPPIEITESQSEYKMIVQLSGIDPRHIYIFAMPQSILIEIRFKSLVRHETKKAAVMESIDQRIAREFSLPVEIEQGATTIRTCGESLVVTAQKAKERQETSWSQLIQFDTRVSACCA